MAKCLKLNWKQILRKLGLLGRGGGGEQDNYELKEKYNAVQESKGPQSLPYSSAVTDIYIVTIM